MNLKNFKIVIVEDEVIIAESIKLYLIQMGCEQVEMVHDIETAKLCFDTWLPSFVLLDIRLENDDDGIKLGRILTTKGIPFMFITANTDNRTTQRILETQPAGFVSKPIRFNAFKINLHLLVKEYEKSAQRLISLSNGNDVVKFEESKLNYLMSDGNYVEVHLSDQRLIIRNSLERCLNELSSENFIRIHRSYIVNSSSILKLSSNEITLKTDEILPISRSYSKGVKSIFKKI